MGFDNVGNVTQKFFWYWFFNFLHQATMLFMGEFFVSLAPNEQTAQSKTILELHIAWILYALTCILLPFFIVLGSLTNTVLGLFGGFLIGQQNFPTFWLFMYWLDPLHYALEGLIMSQFHGDTSPITTMDGSVMTAEDYIQNVQFPAWNYSNIGYDVLALCLFIGCSL